MKNKKIIVLLLLFLLSSVLAVNAEALYNIEVVDEPTYYLYRQEKKPSKFYYYINITLKNTGTENSIPIEVHLYEDEKKTVTCDYCENVVLKPNEEKTFIFDYKTPNYQESVTLKYDPFKDSDLEKDKNSGSIVLNINEKKPTENTPGFQILTFITVLFAIIFYKKIKKL